MFPSVRESKEALPGSHAALEPGMGQDAWARYAIHSLELVAKDV
jgi:hypothetical protein